MEEDERAKIIADVNLENRVKALEIQQARTDLRVDRIYMGFVAAAVVLFTSFWDQLKSAVFK